MWGGDPGEFLWPRMDDASDTAQARGNSDFPWQIILPGYAVKPIWLLLGTWKLVKTSLLHQKKHKLKAIFKRITIYVVLLVRLPLVWQIIYNIERSESF